MRTRLLAIGLVALVPLAFLAGRWTGRPADDRTDAAGRRILYYVDPMNPSFRSSEPGIAPCGMPLEPVYADSAPGATGEATSGAVAVRPDRQRLVGIRVAAVSRSAGADKLRLLGKVAVDEGRLYRLFSVTGGWVREVGAATTGSVVRKGDVLAAYYAPETATPQQNLIYQFETLAKVRTTGSNPFDNLQGGDQQAAYERNVRTGRQALLNLGMSPEQVEEVLVSRKVAPLVEIRSPAAGVVLSRNVSNGQRFEPGAELYTIADLGRVWVLADVSERDATALTPGTRLTVMQPGTGRTRPARVSSVPPWFDASTRTLKVRLEVDNPGYVLRPDMFVDVEMPVEAAAAIAVPKEAVLDSGTRRVVYVEASPGVFEPRRVEIGQRLGDRVEILSGLNEGDRVVVSGNFLLDSESRMRAAGSEETSAGERHAHGAAPSAPEATAAAHLDPICGMTVDPAEAKAAGRVSIYGGRTYYFCNPACKRTFDADPAAHVVKPEPKDARGGAATSARAAPDHTSGR
jgi:membrane fusion protein, copper/silver efflux system